MAQQWMTKDLIPFVLTDNAAKVAEFEKKFGISQEQAVDDFIEHSCWGGEDLPHLVGHNGNATIRLVQLRRVLRAAGIKGEDDDTPTNIGKLCEEINAMQEEDPQFFLGRISTAPGEQRIYLDFLMEPIVTGYIEFEKLLPYDASGATGTTDDVYAGAILHVTVTDHKDAMPGEADRLRRIYPLCVYFDLNDAARAGKISSKILAEWPITREQRLERARTHRAAVKQHKKDFENFLAELGPGPHTALREHHAASRTEWKKKKQARRKKRPAK